MIGSKHLSDLITDPNQIKPGYINIIEANVSGGKTYFALNTLPKWAGSPDKILYLIDTLNGEMRIRLQNIMTISRQDYELCFYGKKEYGNWGEPILVSKGKMPVMTYAGFGYETMKPHTSTPFWTQFDFIVCDEIQNLVKYQSFKKGDPAMLMAAERVLREIVGGGKTKVIGMSATPRLARERFGPLCYDVPFDRSELCQLETFDRIPYRKPIEEILADMKGKTGILYTAHVTDMKEWIEWANRMGIRANGFWSSSSKTQAKYPDSPQQRRLRETVLRQETIPDDIDLLVLNASSETSIKINGDKRKVDYMIVHDCNSEVQTQVRGRYHGDLPRFYYHNPSDANSRMCDTIPDKYLGVRLYRPDCDKMCQELDIHKPNDDKSPYKWNGIKKLLEKNGYIIHDCRDKAKGRYHIIERPKEGANSGMDLI